AISAPPQAFQEPSAALAALSHALLQADSLTLQTFRGLHFSEALLDSVLCRLFNGVRFFKLLQRLSGLLLVGNRRRLCHSGRRGLNRKFFVSVTAFGAIPFSQTSH